MPSSMMVIEPPEKLKTPDIAQNAALIAKSIEDASGIPTVGYKRAPAGVQICIFSINQNALRIWPGAANFELIDADREAKQVVFRIKEDARKVVGHYKCDLFGIQYKDERWYKTYPYSTSYPDEINIESFENKALSGKLLSGTLSAWLGISFPVGTKYSYEVQGRYMENRPNQYRPNQENYVAYDYLEITAKVPSMDMYVLAGYDENALFICELPQAVTTVAQAHESLMPKEVRQAPCYVRQGEWFFVPVSDKEESYIADLLAKADFDSAKVKRNDLRYDSLFHNSRSIKVSSSSNKNLEISSGPLEAGSSHLASSMLVISSGKSTKTYVSGLITDNRPKHHRPVMLSGWHRAYRNLEVVRNLDGMDHQRRRYWD